MSPRLQGGEGAGHRSVARGQPTKIHAVTDVLGRPGILLLTPGNASDVPNAPAGLAEAPSRISRLTLTRFMMPIGSAPTFAKWGHASHAGQQRSQAPGPP